MSSDWSILEVEAVVADYFAMLAKELRGESYNKTAHRRALSVALNGRTDGSIERKHQNISAILIELGYPYISGYKPLSNYQRLLAEVVTRRVCEDAELTKLVNAAVDAPAVAPDVDNILSRLEDPPKPLSPANPVYPGISAPKAPSLTGTVNYFEREARNAALGLAGEQFVINFERARLISIGREDLADSIEHLPSTGGDGAGFDIKSFEPDGSDRLIEVKTTSFGKLTPFFLSRNELRVSRKWENQYHLYRVFTFRKDPRMFVLQGAVDKKCRLEPVEFRGWVA